MDGIDSVLDRVLRVSATEMAGQGRQAPLLAKGIKDLRPSIKPIEPVGTQAPVGTLPPAYDFSQHFAEVVSEGVTPPETINLPEVTPPKEYKIGPFQPEKVAANAPIQGESPLDAVKRALEPFLSGQTQDEMSKQAVDLLTTINKEYTEATAKFKEIPGVKQVEKVTKPVTEFLTSEEAKTAQMVIPPMMGYAAGGQLFKEIWNGMSREARLALTEKAELAKNLANVEAKDIPENLVAKLEGVLPKAPGAAKAEAKPPAVEAALGKEPWAMSKGELQTAYDAKLAEEKAGDISIFGSAEKLKQYNRAQKMSESLDSAKAAEGSRIVGQMEDALTEVQRNKLFGVGEKYVADDYKALLDAAGKLDFSSPESLGESLKYALTRVGKATDPTTMASTELQAYYQIKIASDEATKLGWDTKRISESALRGAAQRFGDVEDAKFMLQRFAKGEFKALPEPKLIGAAEVPPIVSEGGKAIEEAYQEILAFERTRPATKELYAGQNDILDRISQKYGVSKGELIQGVKNHEYIPPAEGGIPPVKPPGPVLKKVMDMWQPREPVGPSFKEKILDAQRFVEEKLSDRFAGINKLTARARKEAGGQLPVELDAELQAANLAGAGSAGVQKAKDTYRLATTTLGKEVSPDYLDAYLHLRHNIDVLAMHPQRQVAGGIKGLAEVNRGIEEIKQALGPNFVKVEQAADVIKQHYANLLDAKVKSGLVSQDLADLLKSKYPYYNPIRYLDDIAQYSDGVGKQISVTSNGIKRLSELGSETVRERPLNSLVSATLKDEALIRRNDAARAIIRLAEQDDILGTQVKRIAAIRPVAQVEGQAIYRRPPGEIPGTISYMDNGKRIVYEVPRWLEHEAKTLSSIPKTSLESAASAINSVSKTGFTGMNVAFYAPNLGIDALTAMINEGVGPARLLKRLALSLKDVVSEDKLLAQMRREGGDVFGFFGKSTEELSREAAKKGSLILKNPWDWKRVMGAPIEAIEKVGHAVEMSTRSAVFEKKLSEGMALERAILAARRGTVDFSRSGELVRRANAFYIYLNAGVQGSLLPWRMLRDHPKSRLFLAGLMSSMVGNYAWNRQFPEYDDVPDRLKYGAYLFMIPSNEYDKQGNKVPHYITMIPNNREWAFFTAPIVYTLRKLDQRAPEDFGTYLSAIGQNVNPLSQITQGGTATPTQLGSTVSELAMNKDTYRDKPIVPPELEGRPAAEQYDNNTPEIYRRIGKALKTSPMKLQYFIDNVFGGVGQQIVSGMNAVLGKVSPSPQDKRIEGLVNKLKEITPPNVAPEDVSRKRNEFLYSLSAEDRKAVEDAERKSKGEIPVITPIYKRIYREYGGQLYKTGQTLAEKQTGISAKQTSQASKILGQVSEELQVGQEQVDQSLKLGKINYLDWVQNHKDSGTLYRGVIMAMGILYPDAAQTQKDPKAWGNYMENVFTLAAAMPDRRERGQVLTSGYRAIQPEELTAGKMDFDTFNTRREEFKSRLIPEDRRLLEDELKVRSTPIERIYQEAGDKSLNEYFNLDEGMARSAYRVVHPEIDANLNLLGIATSVMSPRALTIVKEKAGSLGLPTNTMPGLGESFTDLQGKEVYKAKDITDSGLWDNALSFLPKYSREYLWDKGGWNNPELSNRITTMSKAKASDQAMLDKYEEVNQYDRERFRAQNPDIDVALNVWGRVSEVKSAKALSLLKQRASDLGIPFTALPISSDYKRKEAQQKAQEAKTARTNRPGQLPVTRTSQPQSIDFLGERLARYGLK